MINIGVIGYGYWGPNLVRNFNETPGSQVAGLSDMSPVRLALASKRHSGLRCTQNHLELLNDPSIDAIAIATPVATHFELAQQALRAGKHVWVEKPLSANSEQGERLIEEASRRKRTLMVDHTFVYTGAVRKIKELIDSGKLGKLYYYDSVRINLGLFQHDVNVLWDLAVHDLSIMDFVLSQKPRAVSATGIAHVPGQPEDVAYMTCLFENDLIAHFHVNWLAPVKVRRILIGGNRQMIVYDDVEPSEKVKVYDKGINVDSGTDDRYQLLVGYRSGDMSAPQLSTVEALQVAAHHFVECIETGARPITDGVVGLRLVRILEAAAASMSQKGHLVELHLEGMSA